MIIIANAYELWNNDYLSSIHINTRLRIMSKQTLIYIYVVIRSLSLCLCVEPYILPAACHLLHAAIARVKSFKCSRTSAFRRRLAGLSGLRMVQCNWCSLVEIQTGLQVNKTQHKLGIGCTSWHKSTIDSAIHKSKLPARTKAPGAQRFDSTA